MSATQQVNKGSLYEWGHKIGAGLIISNTIKFSKFTVFYASDAKIIEQ